ncbi:MAG TPA: DUF4203 domain-containing protein [Vicinamibacterales bacterium]
MLPASFQVPAAIALILGGLLSCFAGYRVFRVVLGIYGFILGAMLASSAMGTDNTMYMLGAALLGGLVGALILIAAYFVGVALIGAGIGALVANLVWAMFGREPGLIAVIVLAILGALGALALQRYVVIVATAFGGAQTVIVGAAALMGNKAAAETASRAVYRFYPIDPLPQTKWDVVAWLALGTVGVVVQLLVTAKGRK